jgi:bis(5'-nucleosidyl)-tetraphosphatase
MKSQSGTIREEFSAGFVLFQNQDNTKKFLLLNYGQHWDYPKGHLEADEEPLAAARRELAEETGISDIQRIAGFQEVVIYTFTHRRKGLIRKKVTFYLAATEQAEVKLSDEHVGYAWLDLGQALERLTYPTARDLLQSAARFLSAR